MIDQKILTELITEGNFQTWENNRKSGHGEFYGQLSGEYQSWVTRVEDFILKYYGENSAPFRLFSKGIRIEPNGNYQESFEQQKTTILASLNSCTKIVPNELADTYDSSFFLNKVFERFHLITRQLRNRYNGRNTLEVEDEYDVQDLLHSLLRLFFDDIRAEEWTPSYAGGSSRMDFLLKKEKIVIEVKKTRQGLSDKDLGKQLIEDKAKYSSHPDCKKLICFTYDPEGRIVNPAGIQHDLNSKDNSLEVEIVIKP